MVVVGAGLAGLRCAQVLGEHGVEAVVLERADHVGGRVHSFALDGHLVDQGFQLVNPAYPELVATGVLEGLGLRPFPRAVEVRRGERRLVLANPLRHPRAVPAAIRLGPPGSWARLALGLARLRETPARRLLAGDDVTTLEGLRHAGLDDRLVTTVVRPFLRGVLLEDGLDSSWAFTRLLAKSFARGRPSTHPEGVAALARALAARSGAVVHLGTRVTAVSPTSVSTEGGTLAARAVVVATDAHDAAGLVGTRDVTWRRQITWWWSTPRLDAPGRLRLDDDPLTTCALDLAAVAPERAPRGRSLIATPSIDGAPGDDERVRDRVARLYGLATGDVELVTVTDVARALPLVSPPLRAVRPHVVGGVVLAGDHLTTSSIQGALVSGRRAAAAVLAGL